MSRKGNQKGEDKIKSSDSNNINQDNNWSFEEKRYNRTLKF